MAYMIMAYMDMAYMDMAYIVMAYVVMAYMVKDYIVMTQNSHCPRKLWPYIVMALHSSRPYIVMALYSYGSTGASMDALSSERPSSIDLSGMDIRESLNVVAKEMGQHGWQDPGRMPSRDTIDARDQPRTSRSNSIERQAILSKGYRPEDTPEYHNYTGHNCLDHIHVDHIHVGHTYVGHNYIGHNYIGP